MQPPSYIIDDPAKPAREGSIDRTKVIDARVMEALRAARGPRWSSEYLQKPEPQPLMCPSCRGVMFIMHGHGGIQCVSCNRNQAAHWEPNPGSGA
jgi:hypothetical protein